MTAVPLPCVGAGVALEIADGEPPPPHAVRKSAAHVHGAKSRALHRPTIASIISRT